MGPLEINSLIPQLKVGKLAGCSRVSSWIFSISKDGNPCSLSEQPVLVLKHPHSEKSWNVLYFSLCSLRLFLSVGNTEKSLALFSLSTFLSTPNTISMYLYTLIPRVFSMLSSPSSLSCFSCDRCSKSFYNVCGPLLHSL